MKEYLAMCRYVLEHGTERKDRTGTGTISVFGYQYKIDVSKGFPLLTTKKVFYRGVLEELLFFIRGKTNIRDLVKENVNIWNEWPYETYKKSADYRGETMAEFIEKIKTDAEFARKYGDLGPVYGKQWRDFNGVDQLKEVQRLLKEDPFSRRIIISAWNPADVPNMALPPCHAFLQFYVSGDKKKLSLKLYQRSGDLFLGVPFNIASYATLLMMTAKVCGYEPYEFIHTFGDLHIYKDHVAQIRLQLTRAPRPLPRLIIKKEAQDIAEFTRDDFELVDYHPYPAIKGKVSV